jgi:imidazolonepropionase-like amidohydrolase
MKKLNFILAAFLGLGIQIAQAQTPKGNILIKNASVLTVTKGNLEATDVLVQDGVIKQIGKNLNAPSGVQTIDATGKFLMPGIIDAHSHVALDVVNEASSPITSEVRMKDVVNPFEVGIYRALAGGVTPSHMQCTARPTWSVDKMLPSSTVGVLPILQTSSCRMLLAQLNSLWVKTQPVSMEEEMAFNPEHEWVWKQF